MIPVIQPFQIQLNPFLIIKISGTGFPGIAAEFTGVNHFILHGFVLKCVFYQPLLICCMRAGWCMLMPCTVSGTQHDITIIGNAFLFK